MGTLREALRKTAEKMELPLDAVMGEPCLIVTGTHECTIDKHMGILSYENDEITVAMPKGTITFCGEHLQIKLMHRDRLCLCGSIRQIVFTGGNG
ncbi:MAG: hypothetical protein IIY04_03145 [Oscillospiraceae bacterium]|nr:hypothetical protein [Oscillospiraceae bacterium]